MKELDLDTCVFCKATGCEDGTAEHADDCPSETGVFPVRESDLIEHTPCDACGHRNYVGMGCCRCEIQFEVGDYYHHIEVEPQVFEVVCTGCAAKEAVSP